MFVPLSPLTIKDELQIYYQLSESIKKGTFGTIQEGKFGLLSLGIHRKTGKKYAIKTIWKKLYPPEKTKHLEKEISLSLSLIHPNIRRCYEVYEDAHGIHMVLELTSNGDLLDYVLNCEQGVLGEEKAAIFISQTLDALIYLQANRVVHRDLKLENFLIFEEDSKVKVKLIDFGFATKITDEGLTEKLGSLPYMAPEIFNELFYDEKVDIWAVGILMFNMLTGRQPFYGESESDMMDKIIKYERISFKGEMYFLFNFSWKSISNEAKELLKCLLMKEPFDRPSAHFARQHK
jgi:serine/threonine protein kinase